MAPIENESMPRVLYSPGDWEKINRESAPPIWKTATQARNPENPKQKKIAVLALVDLEDDGNTEHLENWPFWERLRPIMWSARRLQDPYIDMIIPVPMVQRHNKHGCSEEEARDWERQQREYFRNQLIPIAEDHLSNIWNEKKYKHRIQLNAQFIGGDFQESAEFKQHCREIQDAYEKDPKFKTLINDRTEKYAQDALRRTLISEAEKIDPTKVLTALDKQSIDRGENDIKVLLQCFIKSQAYLLQRNRALIEQANRETTLAEKFLLEPKPSANTIQEARETLDRVLELAIELLYQTDLEGTSPANSDEQENRWDKLLRTFIEGVDPAKQNPIQVALYRKSTIREKNDIKVLLQCFIEKKDYLLTKNHALAKRVARETILAEEFLSKTEPSDDIIYEARETLDRVLTLTHNLLCKINSDFKRSVDDKEQDHIRYQLGQILIAEANKAQRNKIRTALGKESTGRGEDDIKVLFQCFLKYQPNLFTRDNALAAQAANEKTSVQRFLSGDSLSRDTIEKAKETLDRVLALTKKLFLPSSKAFLLERTAGLVYFHTLVGKEHFVMYSYQEEEDPILQYVASTIFKSNVYFMPSMEKTAIIIGISMIEDGATEHYHYGQRIDNLMAAICALKNPCVDKIVVLVTGGLHVPNYQGCSDEVARVRARKKTEDYLATQIPIIKARIRQYTRWGRRIELVIRDCEDFQSDEKFNYYHEKIQEAYTKDPKFAKLINDGATKRAQQKLIETLQGKDSKTERYQIIKAALKKASKEQETKKIKEILVTQIDVVGLRILLDHFLRYQPYLFMRNNVLVEQTAQIAKEIVSIPTRLSETKPSEDTIQEARETLDRALQLTEKLFFEASKIYLENEAVLVEWFFNLAGPGYYRTYSYKDTENLSFKYSALEVFKCYAPFIAFKVEVKNPKNPQNNKWPKTPPSNAEADTISPRFQELVDKSGEIQGNIEKLQDMLQTMSTLQAAIQKDLSQIRPEIARIKSMVEITPSRAIPITPLLDTVSPLAEAGSRKDTGTKKNSLRSCSPQRLLHKFFNKPAPANRDKGKATDPLINSGYNSERAKSPNKGTRTA